MSVGHKKHTRLGSKNSLRKFLEIRYQSFQLNILHVIHSVHVVKIYLTMRNPHFMIPFHTNTSILCTDKI